MYCLFICIQMYYIGTHTNIGRYCTILIIHTNEHNRRHTHTYNPYAWTQHTHIQIYTRHIHYTHIFIICHAVVNKQIDDWRKHKKLHLFFPWGKRSRVKDKPRICILGKRENVLYDLNYLKMRGMSCVCFCVCMDVFYVSFSLYRDREQVKILSTWFDGLFMYVCMYIHILPIKYTYNSVRLSVCVFDDNMY